MEKFILVKIRTTKFSNFPFIILKWTDIKKRFLQNVKIVHQNELVSGRILLEGDLDTLEKAKFQLESSMSVCLIREETENSVDICRTSGEMCRSSSEKRIHSKYVISSDEEEEDPYQDSGSDYAPSEIESPASLGTGWSNDLKRTNSVKRKLFVDEAPIAHVACSQNKDVTSPFNLVGSCNSLVEPGTSATSSDDIRSSDSPSSLQTSLSETCLAAIHIEKSEVSLTITSPILHCGTYSGKIVQLRESFVGFVYGSKNTNFDHVCVDHVEYVECVFKRTDLNYDMIIPACLHKNDFNGIEVYLPSSNVYVTRLKVNNDTHCEIQSNPHSRKTKTKQHNCLFCNKLFTYISRHLRTQHADESEVKNILKMPANSVERNKALRRLQLTGDKVFNEKCPMSQRIFVRTPKVSSLACGVTCSTCGGMFSKLDYAKHNRFCSGRPANRQRVTKAALMQSVGMNYSHKILHKLIKTLSDDSIRETIEKDNVLMLLAKHYSGLVKNDEHTWKNRREQLRRCARLLKEIKKIDPTINNFEDCLVGGKYETIMQGIYALCGLSYETNSFKAPSLAVHFRYLLTDMATILSNYYRKTQPINYKLKVEELSNFLTVHLNEFRSYVSRGARITVAQRRVNQITVIPSLEDTKKYADFVRRCADETYNDLVNVGFEYQLWLKLMKSLMLQIMLFNRRRVGESSHITIKQFENRQSISNEQKEFLTVLQRALADNFSVMYIRGKRNRRLPILLTATQVERLEYCLKFRVMAGVDCNNQYLFGTTHSDGHLDASQVIREFSVKCGAAKPDTIRGTTLRKQVATLSQMLSLSDNEIHQLADFMGHNHDVHLKHYRTSELNTEITKLSKFFMMVGNVDPTKYRGKSIEELEVTPDNLDDDGNFDASGEHIPINLTEHSLAMMEEGPSSEVLQVNIDVEQNSNRVQDNQSIKKTPSKKVKSKKQVRTPTKQTTNQLLLQVSKTTPKRNRIRTKLMWTPEEKELMMSVFSEYFNSRRLPNLMLCDQVAKKYKDQLRNRTGQVIYAWLRCEKIRRRQQQIFS